MKTILLFVTSALTLLIPIKGMLILLLLAVLIDTISGIYISIRLKGRSSFKSALLRKGLAGKIFLYMSTTILLFLIDLLIFESNIFGITFFLAKTISLIWIYNEAKSLDENSQKIGNKPFIKIMSEFLGFANKFKKEVEKLTHIGSQGSSEKSDK